ncbi:187-kDa microtubule-associated protein AIR9 [Selaginella moellendorffii]|uniref:187-kDa microtubule-associated protein AIR9 n=1 Tax=Selaginella moellendorffii TaxID=88036 RepID=UPI000D1CFE30|nr:187-kDa microtubule-associated protein AIR9 [Selaginella moellendorffii]|eukprot:XP_024515548.1 187-kDa microtubule-associated protein AIR9 [Selaginella moellendorffii]
MEAAKLEEYRPELSDPPLEIYSDDNAGPMLDGTSLESGEISPPGGSSLRVTVADPDDLPNGKHDDEDHPDMASEAPADEEIPAESKAEVSGKVKKGPSLGRGSGSSNGGRSLARTSSGTMKKSPASSPGSTTPVRPFLKSSSPAAIARRQQEAEANGNGNGFHTSSKSNGSISAPVTPRASAAAKASASSMTTTPKAPALKKRTPGVDTPPVTPSSVSSRRSSISPGASLSRSTGTSFGSTRRQSLPALSARSSAPSAAELKRWANSSSSSSRISSSKPTTPSRVTSLSLHSPGSVSKPNDYLRRSSPSVLNSPGTPGPKSPGPSVRASSKLCSPSSKSGSSSFSASRGQVANGSPSSLQKKSGPMAVTKRSPRAFESPTISSRSMSSEKTLSSDKLAARRKSLTPEARDTRLITLPPVDVKAGDDVRLDLRGQKLRSLDCNLVHLTPKLEFVYLRDNKLSNMDGIEILKRVKVLDLSFNEFKGGGFEPLANCKALQQLYLAGNQITSLSGLPQLPNLEFLSVAQNRLKSLAMATQPRLQVLAASKNKISTLKGFPHLPALEHLRLEENPILEVPHLEAASILLVGPTLKKFNDRDLSAEEREVSLLYPASTALCIRDGWELCSPEEAAESTTEFLISQWKDNLPHGFTLRKAFIDRPFEEDPCHCEFVFGRLDDGEGDLTLLYQWFIGEQTPVNFEPIEGATNKIYWPKHEDVGYCLKVDCTPYLGDQQFPPVSAFSFAVSPGTGCPKVLSIQVDGEPVEGNSMVGSAEVAWCGGTPGSGVVSWLRKTENNSPVAIVGAEDYEYRLVLDDVGAHLLFMYTPVTEEGTKGESQYAITPVIDAASPSVANVRITGEFVEGNTIRGTGKYFGGKEGTSKFEWFREEQDSGDFTLVSKGSSEYLLTEEDVGLRMKFVYTPANIAGACGVPASATSDKILLAPPRILQLRLVGDMREGSKIVVSGIFIGGTEGASRVQWFKTDTPHNTQNLEPISTSKIAKAFRIPLGAVGHYLAAEYTPVRSDGESGDSVYVVSDARVEMLPPSLSFLTITGELLEGETLTASYGYVGGYEGASQHNWYLHESKNATGSLIAEASGSLQYSVTEDAVNKYISFHCLPIRDDGAIGERVVTMIPEPISPGSPKLLTFQIVGEPVEGAELKIEKKYWGGKEGSSNIQWFVTSPDGTQREIRGATDVTYTLKLEDVHGLVCCSCEPVREDGVRGPISVSQLLGPVLPGPPSCTVLEIFGSPVEGEHLFVNAVYNGGDKGPCELEWWRRNSSGEQKYLGNSESLKLTYEDVGARIKVVFIPVRSDGIVGEAYAVTSEVVQDAEPEGKALVIPDCHEDVELVPTRTYFGGQEGESHYMWYRTSTKVRDSILPIDAEFVCSSLSYTPELEDVDAYLVLEWTPVRQDGKQGKPVIAYSKQPVIPAEPSVRDVTLKEVSLDMFVGDAYYHGGREGESQLSWYRESANGTTTLIEGATSKTYVASEEDYTYRIIFGYTPVRDDGVVGDLVVSEPSKVIYPELPRVQKFVLSGKVIEGEVLTALEVMPKGETQQRVWDKYKKEIKYQWSRSTEPGSADFEPISQQRSCTYKVRLEDIGYLLCCECVIYDVFGRSTDPISSTTPAVQPAFPRIDKLEIEGRGFHTNLYAVRGIYVGGREGKSSIQWFRAMAGSPDLIPIPGETGRMYEANVDDVGYRLVAIYTPVREDGVEGNPTSASTDPIEVEPEVAKEVKQKLELGAVKFEVLRDRDRSPASGPQQQQALGSLERRILDINRKRIKVIKPGSKTSFPYTEIRGTYAPPFHVELFRNDQHRLKTVIDSENEVDLMVRTRHIRDVIALTIRGLAQRYNSTPLNLLLKM